jgi:excisionase family DNA binding protein
MGAMTVPSTNTSRSPALLDVAALAQRLGVTERFVRRLVAERRVPFYKVGKFVRFDPDRIDAWLAATSVDCTCAQPAGSHVHSTSWWSR